MKNLKILSSKFLAMIFCLLITTHTHAAGFSSADCEAALVVASTPMDFGSYMGGTMGTITMDIASGLMSYSGVTGVGSNVGMPATFDLTTTLPQCKNRDVVFNMPGSIIMSNGGTTISITPSADMPSPTTFKVGSNTIIKMAGTLNATPVNPGGTYNGNFNVTFTYVPF